MQSGSKIQFTGLARQYAKLKPEILSAVDQVLSSGLLMNGNYTSLFESWLRQQNRCNHAITVHSGTCALEIIAEFYFHRVKHDHDLDNAPPTAVLPTFTFAATANAFLRSGWRVILADVNNDGVIDINKAVQDNNKQVDLIVPVGLYGKSLIDYCPQPTQDRLDEMGIALIEDAAQHWLSSQCSRLGEAAAISFDPTKNLANIGNGGAIVTDRNDLYQFAKDYVNNNNSKFKSLLPGTNVRMSEVDCATMMVKTQYLDQWQARRREICQHWVDQFAHLPVRCLMDSADIASHACHKFVIDVDGRDRLKKKLEESGIETKIHYASPLHENPMYGHLKNPGILSVASSLARRVLSLPIYPELTDAEVEFIAEAVKSATTK